MRFVLLLLVFALSHSVSVQVILCKTNDFAWAGRGWERSGRTQVDTSQAGHAGECSCHSCPVSLWASKASAFTTQKLWVLWIRCVRRVTCRSHKWEHSYRIFIYGDIKYATIISQHQSNKHHCSIWSEISKRASHIHRQRQNAKLFMLWIWTNIEK